MIGILRGPQCELVKPEVLPAQGIRPMKQAMIRFSYVRAQRKASSVPFRTTRCFRGHYTIQKQGKRSYFKECEEMAIRSEDMASVWGRNRL